MQLFITNNFKLTGNKIHIFEGRIVNQLRKVLRAKTGYEFYIQFTENTLTKRFFVKLLNLKNVIDGEVLSIEQKELTFQKKSVITAILNKFDKMEIIVQKLTEIGIYEIGFVPTKRSVFKQIKKNKLQRFYKISLEAAEQSWSWFLPSIKIYSDLSEIKGKKAILDFNGIFYKQSNLSDIDVLLVGPEGGWTKFDLEKIGSYEKISLGDKVLRAETAAILGGFIML